MNTKSTFGSRLLELRRKAGLSAEKLAAQLGLHRNSIVGYERDLKEPAIGILLGLDAAGLDWVYALRGEPVDEFVADRIRWDLVIEILSVVDAKNAALKKKLTAAQRMAVLRMVYRAEVGRRRGVKASVEDALKIAA